MDKTPMPTECCKDTAVHLTIKGRRFFPVGDVWRIQGDWTPDLLPKRSPPNVFVNNM
jgi:hypothetical protein